MKTALRSEHKTRPLGEVAHFLRGITFKPDDVVDPGTENSVVCMRTANVQADLDQSDLLAVPKQFVRREELYLRETDILVSTANSWNLVGKCCWVPRLAYVATAGGFISILRADPSKIVPRYLYYWFNSDAVQHLVRHCGRQTTNISNMNFERCEALEVPLPPLPEQRRIADILDKADAIRRKRQEAIGQTYDLRRVLLLEFTGDAVSAHVRSELHNTSNYLPKGFKWRRLDEVCDAICDIDHNMPKAVEKGVPFISPKDMPDNEELCFDEVKYISNEDFHRLSRKIKPRRNDIIYSRIGARLGKARLVRVDFDFLPSYSCCTIRVKEEEVHPEYVTYYLDSIITRRQANLDTQSIAVPDLGLAKIKAFLIPVPSMEKQLQFVSQINVINSQISKMKSAVSDANNLFNSLVQKAFRGEL